MPKTDKPKLLTLEEYPEILTGKELAQFLRISERTLYNRRSTGGDLPPPLKISKKIMYARKDVRAWLDGLINAGERHA